VLVELGFMTEESVLDVLSAQLGVPSTRVNSYTVNPDAVQCLSEKVARKHMAFPLLKVGSTLVVAIASPTNLHALDDLRFASGCGIHLMVAMETEIQSALDKYYGNTFGPADNEEVGTVVIDIPGPQLDLHDEVGQRSAVSLVNRIIAKAVVDRASDIHLEPSKNSLRVRFRIDGTFHEVAQLLLALAPAVLARIKVLSAMDIAEHRLPQDGRFSATVSRRGLDVRTSTYPTIWGEKAVLRLLDRTRLQLSIDGLMPPPPAEAFRELINRPEGILLVTGPTGSGKTSTLYAALAEIAEKGKNIITIEDPVEYWLPGVNQGQTNHKSGFTFARGMRAILRQDPDVIMVGEIRDSETLETAIEAALTGHLVMSTLHTNSAMATVARLLEMGLEPYLLASAVTGILAQRLVRRICERCKEPIPTPLELRHLFQGEVPATIYRGIGCDDCRGTGFLGRQGIFELLVLTDELRVMMHERASEIELTEVAKRSGMTTLRDACLARVADGTTTLEEVIRVTKAGRDDGTQKTPAPKSSTPYPQPNDLAARTSTAGP
jgi:type IV pilus assembly protein PilB